VLRAPVCNSREIRNGKTWVGVEVLRFYEAREQIPGHLGQLIGHSTGGGRTCMGMLERVACGKMGRGQGSTDGDEQLRLS
jgi:hypothetical protein